MGISFISKNALADEELLDSNGLEEAILDYSLLSLTYNTWKNKKKKRKDRESKEEGKEEGESKREDRKEGRGEGKREGEGKGKREDESEFFTSEQYRRN